MASTMKAWQYSKIHSTLEKALTLNPSIPTPTQSSLAKHQLLVEVITAAINPIDYKLPESCMGPLIITRPATPGLDFCGRITAKHASNTTFKEGQLVFGKLGQIGKYGTLGQYVVVPCSECALLPEGVEPDQAAAVGTAGATAFQSLLPEHVKTGANVFINGGSGGVGTFAIQFAKALGASVTTTCSAGNVELCKSLGADEVIDYKNTDIIATLKSKGQVFDMAIDNAGRPADLFSHSESFLKPSGAFALVAMQVTVAGIGSMIRRKLQPGFLGGVRRKFHFVSVKSRTEDFEKVGKWMAEGKVKAVIDEAFAFEDVPKAFEKLRVGHTRGKIIVHVGNE